jgi:hypothetical protein
VSLIREANVRIPARSSAPRPRIQIYIQAANVLVRVAPVRSSAVRL